MKKEIKFNITENQFERIRDVIQNYSRGYKEIWDIGHKRNLFEKEFADISDVFKTDSHAVSSILKDFAEEANCPNYKLLFLRLYGNMPEYEGVFSEIGFKPNR